jgi:alpha-tubulin suppressor-like RCC1 family protein
VEALKDVKAIQVATGDYTTFVVAEDGGVYSFGSGESASLGHLANPDGGQVSEDKFEFLFGVNACITEDLMHIYVLIVGGKNSQAAQKNFSRKCNI